MHNLLKKKEMKQKFEKDMLYLQTVIRSSLNFSVNSLAQHLIYSAY